MKYNSQILMACYKQVRNRVNNLNLTLKRQYFSEKITMQQGNMKKSWKTLNQLLNKRSKTTNIDSLKGGNDNNIVDKQEIVETEQILLLYRQGLGQKYKRKAKSIPFRGIPNQQRG